MNKFDLINKALNFFDLSIEEAIFLYKNVSTVELTFAANEMRKKLKPREDLNKVGWIIDRNVNITNLCAAQCKFCNFCRKPSDIDVYVTTDKEYEQKIKVLFEQGGNQLLLQGGLNPKLGLDYYCELFSSLKQKFPALKLHALGPAEIVFIAKMAKLSYSEVLQKLIESGLDSLPGAGAEILVDRVRKIVSPGKCKAQEWLDVMKEAHKLNLPTSATMMFGHVETMEERIEHIIKIRDVQALKPEGTYGFITFVPWPFQNAGTRLEAEFPSIPEVSADEYIRLVAISRILLHNINNIQASWLTVGKEIAQVCLHSGANDFGSIMIEENVVSAAGASNKFDANGIQAAITDAGFIPVRRNQKYEFIV